MTKPIQSNQKNNRIALASAATLATVTAYGLYQLASKTHHLVEVPLQDSPLDSSQKSSYPSWISNFARNYSLALISGYGGLLPMMSSCIISLNPNVGPIAKKASVIIGASVTLLAESYTLDRFLEALGYKSDWTGTILSSMWKPIELIGSLRNTTLYNSTITILSDLLPRKNMANMPDVIPSYAPN